jgi:hypothetical protein
MLAEQNWRNGTPIDNSGVRLPGMHDKIPALTPDRNIDWIPRNER